jgi:CubicO group peptidase (beta-lactamase class C family)
MTSLSARARPLCGMIIGLAGSLAALPAHAGVSGALEPGCTYDLRGITPLVEQFLSANPQFPGAAVVVQVDGVAVYERFFGNYNENTVVPIASATKTPTSALLLALRDDGLLTLDTPVRTFVPEFNAGPLAQITIRQCVSHTSGLPATSTAISSDSLTLAQAVQQIATAGLRRTFVPGQGLVTTLPGTDFCYGGVSMHVSGRVAEVAAGVPYAQLLSQRILLPSGMPRTAFSPGTLANPRIAGGLNSTARDYVNFLQMVLDGGVRNGVRVLSQASCQELLTNQTGTLPLTCSPSFIFPEARYGVGIWLERTDAQGETTQASGIGAFGFNGWLDPQRRIAGVFMVSAGNGFQESGGTAEEVKSLVRQTVDAGPRPIADIVAIGGEPLPPPGPRGDGLVTGDDFVAFIRAFASNRQLADVARIGGEPAPDGRVTGDDFVAFINAFAVGCP